MRGDVYLVGGDEFRAACEPLDRAMLATLPRDPRVLIVPTAAAFERPERAVANGIEYFRRLGAYAAPLPVLRRTDADDPELADRVERVHLIYLTGGNPGHLLNTFRDSLVWRAIVRAVQAGTTLAGSSAGAMVLGTALVWGRNPTETGLGLVPVVVVPHAEVRPPEDIEAVARLIDGGQIVLGIPTSGCVRVSGNSGVVVAGRVTVREENLVRIATPGTSIDLAGPDDV